MERSGLNVLIRAALARLLVSLTGFLVRMTEQIRPVDVEAETRSEDSTAVPNGWPEDWARRIRQAGPVSWFSFRSNGPGKKTGTPESDVTPSEMEASGTNGEPQVSEPSVERSRETAGDETTIPDRRSDLEPPRPEPVSVRRVFDQAARLWVEETVTTQPETRQTFRLESPFPEKASGSETTGEETGNRPETPHVFQTVSRDDAAPAFRPVPVKHQTLFFRDIPVDRPALVTPDHPVEAGFSPVQFPGLDLDRPRDVPIGSGTGQGTYSGSFETGQEQPLKTLPPLLPEEPKARDERETPRPWPALEAFDLVREHPKTMAGSTASERQIRLEHEQKGQLWSVSRF